ncbi:galactosylceramide sulfotransferase-like [Brachionus plicatilis]|uniref:Galactosylceramide sulfotransferase-like n=1 Tax=Brachionus plicatilis TaxID=10195 RepID=A0A3M7STP4_BRAPC|nr:galactosylceramide sulfotransferase-like [Brachionus plicatilis]
MSVIQRLRGNHTKNVYTAKNKIFFGHTIHNSKLVRKIFPKNNSIYITIIRDPVKQFLSSLNYNPIKAKMKELHFRSIYNKTLTVQTNFTNYSKVCFTRNLMSYDLGLVKCGDYYKGSKKQLLKEFQQDFDLVLLTEYFNEGMVLLKKFLNLSFQDIVCLTVNEGTFAPIEQQRLLAQEIIPKQSNADYILFYQKLAPLLREEINVPYKAYKLVENLPPMMRKICWMLTETNIMNKFFKK